MIQGMELKDFQFKKTEVNTSEIEKFTSEEQFMSLCVDLFKEVAIISSILACAYRLDEKDNPRKWSRNEAILGGLMIRVTKLAQGLLDQTCQQKMEIAHILLRCYAECLINLKYLLINKSNDKLFDEFIEYSLREEKRLLIKINNNISERGYELPIEIRMKRSIERSFKTSNFAIDKVKETVFQPWGEKIYERARSVGMEEVYFAMFSLPSHAIHGNWQDLIMYHLEDDNGEFSPKPDWSCPRPQYLFAAALLSAEVNKLYLSDILPDCPDKEEIMKLLDDVIIRIGVADGLHETFLQKK